MYLVRNALLNVWRNRSRNILLGITLLVVIATSVIAMMISSTSNGIIDDYRGRFSSEVRFVPNMQKVREEAEANSENGMIKMQMPAIDPEDYVAFGDSEYLADSVYTATTGIVPEGLEMVDQDLGGGTGARVAGGPAGGSGAAESMEFFGTLRGGEFAEFQDGTRALASGEMPNASGEVIISSELAELNDLAIGDSITADGQLRNSDEGTTRSISYDLTVVGIYDDLTEPYGDDQMQNAFTNTRNQLLTTYDTVLAEYQNGWSGMQVAGTFYLKNPDMLAAFTDEVRRKGLSELFDVTTDTASYETIVAPVEGLKSVAVTFMIVVLVLGGVIVGLLSLMAIRERKYEIGVLRAMGMKRSRVAFGLWTESLVVTGVCMVLGLGVGALAAQPITNVLLAGQVEAAETAAAEQSADPMSQMGGMRMRPGGFDGTDAEPLSQLAVALTPTTLAQIAGVSLLLATLAALIAVSTITRYEPMKILSERN